MIPHIRKHFCRTFGIYTCFSFSLLLSSGGLIQEAFYSSCSICIILYLRYVNLERHQVCQLHSICTSCVGAPCPCNKKGTGSRHVLVQVLPLDRKSPAPVPPELARGGPTRGTNEPFSCETWAVYCKH